MRIDMGLVLGIVLECIIFIYYADALFTRKRNKLFCRLVAVSGYAMHFIGCMFGNVTANVIIFIIINFVSLKWCYVINLKSAVFQSLVLVSVSSVSEWIIIGFDFVGINANNILAINDMQSMILTLSSKVIYIIEIMILLNLFSKRRNKKDVPIMELIIVSLIIFITSLFMMKNTESSLSFIIFITLGIANLILFHINQRMIIKNEEAQLLKEQTEKEKYYYDEYRFLKENYKNISILRHDIKEHISTIEAITDSKKAVEYINNILSEEERDKYIEYTDNQILNILILRKKNECKEKGISFNIEPVIAELDFISDMDVITIFSNLINNAIESSINAEDKKINLYIYEVNNKFVYVKIKNSCIEKPMEIDGKLMSSKNDKYLHGIGLLSVNKAIKKYDGKLKWIYNETEKEICFTLTLLKN